MCIEDSTQLNFQLNPFVFLCKYKKENVVFLGGILSSYLLSCSFKLKQKHFILRKNGDSETAALFIVYILFK